MNIHSNTVTNRNHDTGSNDDKTIVPLSDRVTDNAEPEDAMGEMIRIHMYEELTQLIFNGDEEESGIPQIEL